MHNSTVRCTVEFVQEFEPEFDVLDEAVQDELLSPSELLEQFGPSLGRPWSDTLNGSRHANLKELRFDAADGGWRVAFAFDPRRRGILLVAGDRSGSSERRFYRTLIERADARLDSHLERLKRKKGEQSSPRRKK